MSSQGLSDSFAVVTETDRQDIENESTVEFVRHERLMNEFQIRKSLAT